MTRREFDTVVYWLEGAFRVGLSDGERESYFSLLERYSARDVMRQAMEYAMREDVEVLHFPRPRDLRPRKHTAAGAAPTPGESVVREVRCRCGASIPVTLRAVETDSGVEIQSDLSVMRDHPCRQPVEWPSGYSTAALRRIRRAAGGWQGATLGPLQRAIVEDVDAELRARGEPVDAPSVLTVDPARAAERLRAAAGERT